MNALLIASLLQLFFIAFAVSTGGQRMLRGTYLPVGIAAMGLTFAAMTLATPG